MMLRKMLNAKRRKKRTCFLSERGNSLVDKVPVDPSEEPLMAITHLSTKR